MNGFLYELRTLVVVVQVDSDMDKNESRVTLVSSLKEKSPHIHCYSVSGEHWNLPLTWYYTSQIRTPALTQARNITQLRSPLHSLFHSHRLTINPNQLSSSKTKTP